MLALKCAVCGVQKGEANRWWVLFQADSNQAVLIGPMEEAETLHQWRNQATRFHLCGEQCLYRKLSGIVMRGADRSVNGRHLAQSASPNNALGERGSDANPPVVRCASGPEYGTWLRLSTPSKLRRILGLYNHLGRTLHDSARLSSNTTTGINQRAPLTRVRETAAVTDSLTITGHLFSREPLHVNGAFVGTLELPDDRLTVGPNGNIRAAVSAKEIEIFGIIEGEVKADRVIVRKRATLIGDVCTRALIIEGGAWFEGRSTMSAA